MNSSTISEKNATRSGMWIESPSWQSRPYKPINVSFMDRGVRIRDIWCIFGRCRMRAHDLWVLRGYVFQTHFKTYCLLFKCAFSYSFNAIIPRTKRFAEMSSLRLAVILMLAVVQSSEALQCYDCGDGVKCSQPTICSNAVKCVESRRTEHSKWV